MKMTLPSPFTWATILFLTMSSALAETLPKWEIGAGAAFLNLPDYRGSNQRSTYVLPVPYFAYRGEWLKADREGVRGVLYSGERLTMNVSVNGTLPVNSKDNFARQGMEDLQLTVEIGPTLDFQVWRSPDKRMALDVETATRASFAVGSSPRHIGWLVVPALDLAIKDPGGMRGWSLSAKAGVVFSDRQYNAYFYSVDPLDATASRPAYAAREGYGGATVTWSISKRFPRYWVGGFLRYDALHGAAFEQSPLVRERNALSVGLAISWILKQSSETVEAEY